MRQWIVLCVASLLVIGWWCGGACAQFDPCAPDNMGPLIVRCPGDIWTTTDPGQCTATVSVGQPIALDWCDGVIPASGITGVRSDDPAKLVTEAYPAGTTTITWTAVDAAGNGSLNFCEQYILVFDDEPPTITCPPDITETTTIAAGCVWTPDPADCPWEATASDNCEANLVVGYERSDGLLLCDAYPVGTTEITWTADDLLWHTECTQLVTVTVTDDTTPPTITCPPDVGPVPTCTPDIGMATATDDCATCEVAITNDAPEVFPPGTTTVTWTATDCAGNTSECQQSVIVSLVCPDDIWTWNDYGKCSAVVTFDCPGNECAPALCNCWPPSGSEFPVGTTMVTCLLTVDGVEQTCNFNVTVEDWDPPEVTCQDYVEVAADPGSCEAYVDVGWATATDNCPDSVVNINCTRSDGLDIIRDPYPVGETVIVWDAIDSWGNIGSCWQVVWVYEEEPPEIVCPPDVELLPSEEFCWAWGDLGWPIVTDNCDPDPYVYLERSDGLDPFDCRYPPGVTTVTWTACDWWGNCSSCEQQVTVPYQGMADVQVVRVRVMGWRAYAQLYNPGPDGCLVDIYLVPTYDVDNICDLPWWAFWRSVYVPASRYPKTLRLPPLDPWEMWTIYAVPVRASAVGPPCVLETNPDNNSMDFVVRLR